MTLARNRLQGQIPLQRFRVLGRQFRHVWVFKIRRRHTSKMQQSTTISKIFPEQWNMLCRIKHTSRLKTGDPWFCCTACFFSLVSCSAAQRKKPCILPNYPYFLEHSWKLICSSGVHFLWGACLSAFSLTSLFVYPVCSTVHWFAHGSTHSAIIQSCCVLVRPQGQLRPFIVVYPPAHVVQVLEEERGHYKPRQEQERTFVIGEREDQHDKFLQQM